MHTEIETRIAPSSGLKFPVVQCGPRWVFDLWNQGPHRCLARTAQGGRCRHFVNLQAGVSRYCERHRDASEPVYYIQPSQREEACPCGCGYSVNTMVLQATLIAGHPRRERPIVHIGVAPAALRKTS